MNKKLISAIFILFMLSLTACVNDADSTRSGTTKPGGADISGSSSDVSGTGQTKADQTSAEAASSGQTSTAQFISEQGAEDQPAMVIDDAPQTDAGKTADAFLTQDVVKGNEESDTIVTEENDSSQTSLEDFYISEITDDIFQRIKGKSFKDDCTLPREDLRYLHVLHKDKDGEVHEGEMIVNYHIAQDVLDILKELYEKDYPIEKIRLVDEYGADDETSMEDNNSSSFNFRFISHTTKVSKHGLGLAVDINTLYNPYTKVVDGKRIVEPVTGEPYLDREDDFDYKINKGDLCYELFIEHGFEWGGNWKDRKDYQHFEIPTSQVEKWYP